MFIRLLTWAVLGSALAACAANAPMSGAGTSGMNLALAATNFERRETVRMMVKLENGAEAAADVRLPDRAIVRAPDGEWRIERGGVVGGRNSPFAAAVLEAIAIARSLDDVTEASYQGMDSDRAYMTYGWAYVRGSATARIWLGYRDALPRRIELVDPQGTRVYTFYDFDSATVSVP